MSYLKFKKKEYKPLARSLAQRNLLAITAIIRRTKTVIMAMVITRLVAILFIPPKKTLG